MKRRIKGFHVLIIVLITLLLFQGCNKSPMIDSQVGSEISDYEVPQTSEIINLLNTYFADKPYGAYKTSYIVVESYADLCVIYEYALEYASKEPHIQGNVHGARHKDAYPEEYFKSGYVIAVLIKTESSSYTFECGSTKNTSGIIVNLYGNLPDPCSDELGGYIYLVPIDGSYANESVKLVETYTKETLPDFLTQNSEIINFLDTYFADKPSGTYRTPYIVVESYADLCLIYGYAQVYAGKRPKGSYILHIQGNVNEARINNSYPEEYFKSGYIIAALTKTESGSYTFECGATKKDGDIIVNLYGTLPAVSSCDLGGYIYLVPIDGVYDGESVKIATTYTKLESHPADEVTSSPETTTH